MERLATLEGLLFVAGEEGISLEALAYVLEKSTAVVYLEIQELQEKYEQDLACGLIILEVGNQFILSTKRELAPVLKRFAQSPVSAALSKAALETLSIIAYKQPITRMEVDEIRGVQSSGSVQKLMARDLIKEVGRVDGPGRAILYGTTAYFLDYFGLKSPEDLPAIEDMEIEMDQQEELDLFYDRFQKTLDEEEELEKLIEEEG